MAKVNIDQMCADLEQCAGKNLYGSPETIDLKKLMNGGCEIMCAGLMCAATKSQGVKLYNGSNTIWREYLTDSGYITDGKPSHDYPHKVNGRKSSQLKKGMLVFKWTPTGCAKQAHERDGKGNYQHVGMVTSVSPLHIVHASSETDNVTMDKKIGRWCAWGWIKGFPAMDAQDDGQSKQDDGQSKQDDDQKGEKTMENANGRLKVLTNMNVRKGPGTEYDRIGSAKAGNVLEFAGQIENGWVQIDLDGAEGWLCTKQGKRYYVELIELYHVPVKEDDDEKQDEPVEDPADDEPVEDDDADETPAYDDALKATVNELCEGSVVMAEQMTAVCRILRNAGYDISSVPGMKLPEDIELTDD